MTLKSVISADQALFMDTDAFGVAVTYNGAAITGNVMVQQTPDDDRATGQKTRGVLIVAVSDVADPAYRDMAVIDGVTWRVIKRLGGDDFAWKLLIESEPRPRL